MAQKVEAVVAEDRKEIFVRGDRQWRRPDWRGLAPLAEDEVFPGCIYPGPQAAC